jgi:hypothetical protein
MDESEKESKRMNTYYTAKDIEEMAGNGTKQLVLGPGTFLTDFARETAQQLGIVLVRNEDQVVGQVPEPRLPAAKPTSNKFNKPRGCQPSSNPRPVQVAQSSIPTSQSNGSNGTNNANSVNRLIEMMSKVIKRGS